MKSNKALDAIPTGLTCPGVNRAVVERLLDEGARMAQANVLDIPCGHGDLVRTLRSFFPRAVVRGCDLEKPAALAEHDFAVVDASRTFDVFPDTPFDCIVCVSGVMEFDNTLQFFESCLRHLRPGGRFIVTNDSGVTMRDRLSYLLLGKTRQFEMFVSQNQPTWKVLPLQNLIRLLRDAGFDVKEKPRYVSIERRNWFMLPLALLVYPVQLLYMHLTRNPMPIVEKRGMYPFRSLLCRHYILVCEKPVA